MENSSRRKVERLQVEGRMSQHVNFYSDFILFFFSIKTREIARSPIIAELIQLLTKIND